MKTECKKLKKCVFAGTFDPPTLGHKATVEECLKIFDEVILAVLVNPAKQPYFTEKEREEMLSLTFGNEPKLRIVFFSGTVTELMKREGAEFYARGIRNTVDLEYENANYYASQKLHPDFTAVYIPCRQELLHVSSSMVRNSLRFGTPIDEYVTKEVKEYIKTIREKKE
ncbi:MAG: pantetheine-phosphate adenylyltransferase [Clostridia bacterium]|nr:pantetheine-phosphate adenylyltransferase [Clostridia bacterium]